ncbi:hypothetical protein BIW11_06528, partial [Tropilaelaps mercedesae]
AELFALGALLLHLGLAPPPLKTTHTLSQNTLPPLDYRNHLREHILPQVFYFRSRTMFRRTHPGRSLADSPLFLQETPERRHDASGAVWLVTSSEDQADESTLSLSNSEID